MMHRISSLVSHWLIQNKVITKHDHELFSYAVYSLLWGLMPVLIMVFLGLLSGMLYESMVLIIPVILIRKFSGGYHLESPKHCLVLSILTLVLALGAVQIIIKAKCKIFLTILVFWALLSICYHSPIDSDARKLSQIEKLVFRKIARVLSILAFLLYIVFLLVGHTSSYSALGGGIVVTALLQVPCILLRKRDEELSELDLRPDSVDYNVADAQSGMKSC